MSKKFKEKSGGDNLDSPTYQGSLGDYKTKASLDSETQISWFLDKFSSCGGKNDNCQF